MTFMGARDTKEVCKEVWVTGQNSKILNIEDKINITLVIFNQSVTDKK